MRTTRLSLALGAALAVSLTLTGCAAGAADTSRAGSATASPATSTANDADILFAQMMIPHHEQAVQMSENLLAKTGSTAEVRALATAITAAQQPEIDRFRSWLDAWGADEGMGGMDHGTDGMMSDDDMSMLDDASGADADRLFLEQMIVHHQGAIAMAQTEVTEGRHPDAVALAEQIASSQTAEITMMQDLLEGM
ncbi:DUF305 domain-containing protein [Cryobacterium sp. SO1]|uniref:DUF305 domain-containing protein n=1 Tax=Cryobacterium sp. SO1 TaxID=1897061 RepID=UPI001022B258|nr:DUF305 domain-containing protein [Cryobacterium sp. SO1]RZI37280.1 hypothetical protein BJQ95_00319 [Cryobacterium sp. SO1]